MKNLLISVSGGRSSGMMARYIQLSKKYTNYNKLYVFANTGEEKEETLVFLDNMEKYWNIKIKWIEAVFTMKLGVGIEAIETNFEKASRKGEPFSAMIEKSNMGKYKGVPNQTAPYCSYRLKTIPIEKFAIEYFGKDYQTAIGFRGEDMPKRISFPEIKTDTKRIYPLLTDFETPIFQRDVLKFWKNQKFNLGINSKFGNCKLCWKKSEKNLIETLRKNPEYANFYASQEKKYKNNFFRGNQSTSDLLKKAESQKQLKLFDDIGESCLCNI